MQTATVRPFFVRPTLFTIVFAIALLAGGGGAEGPLQTGIIAAFGAFLLLSVATDHLFGLNRLPRAVWLPASVALLLLLIPLLQLVPLPPDIWQALPGREYAISALGEAGKAQAWRPLTLDSSATMRSTAAMLLPIALFLHVARSSRDDNLAHVRILVACAAVSAIIGALQLAAGHPDWLSFYDGPTPGSASGLFANPNHQSLLMACAMVACAILIRTARDGRPGQPSSRAQQGQFLSWALLFLFAVMSLASGARAGIVLLGLALPGSLLIAVGSGSLLRWAVTMLGAIALLWIIVLFYPGTNSLAVRESFRLADDARYGYLPDILFTLDQYWWAGSGLGTFVDVFAPNENLDLARNQYLNHAHNDYLEWLIETGAAGAAWMVLAAVAVVWVGFKVFQDKNRDFGIAAGGALIVSLIALHSLADYPLRTSTIAAVAAMALGLLPASLPRLAPVAAARGKLIPVLVTLLLALPIGAEALRLFIVQSAVRGGQESLAARIAPTDGRVLAKLGEVALRKGDAGDAESLAVRAITARPMSDRALRVLAMARDEQRKPSGSTWRLASSLGWRDSPTQLWAFRQALSENEPGIAALRADALLRTSNPPPEFIRLVRIAARDPRFATALADRVNLNPQWRRPYFQLVAESSPDEANGLIATLQMLAKKGGTTSRADGRALIAVAIKRKAYEQAIQVDRLVAGQRENGKNLIDDGGFSRTAKDYAENSTSFDWMLRNGPNATASVDNASSSQLIAETDGQRAQLAADRYIRLPAGQYRLSFKIRSDASQAFRVRLTCADRSTPIAMDLPPQSQDFSLRTLGFAVDSACPVTHLMIEGMPVGSAATAEFDDFELVPA